MRSPSAVLHSSPTITVRPSGAASRARSGTVDPVVVGDREVRQPPLGGRRDNRRWSARESKLAEVWHVQIDERSRAARRPGAGVPASRVTTRAGLG